MTECLPPWKSGHVSAPPSILHWWIERFWINCHYADPQLSGRCCGGPLDTVLFLLLSFPCLPLFFPQVFLSPFPPPAPRPVSVALFAESGRVVLSVPFSLPGLLLLLLHPNVVAWVNTPPLPHLLLLFISFTYLPTNLHSFSPNYANAQSSYCSTKATSGSILKKAHN